MHEFSTAIEIYIHACRERAHRNIIYTRCQDLPKISAWLVAPLHLLAAFWPLHVPM